MAPDARGATDRATGPGDHPLVDGLYAIDRESVWSQFSRSFLLPFRAARLLVARRDLWPYVVVPALVNVVLFVGFVTLFWLNLDTVVGWLWSPPAVEAWYDWLFRLAWYLLLALVGVLSAGLSYVLALLVGGLVAGPFRDALSARSERILLGTDEVPDDGDTLLAGTLRGLASDLLVIGAYCTVMVPVVLLNLVPAVGSVAASLLGTVVSALFLAFEFSSDPLGRRGRGLSERVALIDERRPMALGFGVGTSLLLWIPFLNFLTIPVAVVAGTAMGVVLDEWDRAGDADAP